MLGKKKQIKNIVIYMIPFGLSAMLPLITIPIFTRILTPENFGTLALAMFYATFMSSLAEFGMLLAFERNYFQYQHDHKKLAQLFYSGLVFVMTNFFILAGITYLFKENISEFLTGSTQYGFLIIISFTAVFLSSIANSFYYTYFKNQEKAKYYSTCIIIYTIINFILALFFVVQLKIGIIGIAIAHLISSGSLFVVLLYLFLKKLPFSFNKAVLLESLIICYPLTPRIFIGALNTQFDKYMISLLVSLEGTGIYDIGKKISNVSFTFTTALQNVFNPQVYQRMFKGPEQSSNSIGEYLTPFLYISILVAFSIALFSQELISFLTPLSYHGAIPIVTILALHFGLGFFGKLTGLQLIYSKKTHITTYLSFLSIGLNIALNILLIMRFGAIGAACATLLAGLLIRIISICVAQRYYSILYEWKKVAWIMGVFFSGAIIIATLNVFEISYLWSLSVKIIFISVYINLGISFKILSANNFKLIISILHPAKESSA